MNESTIIGILALIIICILLSISATLIPIIWFIRTEIDKIDKKTEYPTNDQIKGMFGIYPYQSSNKCEIWDDNIDDVKMFGRYTKDYIDRQNAYENAPGTTTVIWK